MGINQHPYAIDFKIKPREKIPHSKELITNADSNYNPIT
jgi:hypothetical protein